MNPSSGKSAIGAIVSTIASENPDNTVLVLTSLRDFEAGWNPNDPGRFFWIDDAFGSNVLRDDYVQDWASACRVLRLAKCSASASRLSRRPRSQFGFDSRRYLSKHRSATVRADGRLLGGALESPAPQTTRRRPAFIEASSRVIVSGGKQASAENQLADLTVLPSAELSRRDVRSSRAAGPAASLSVRACHRSLRHSRGVSRGTWSARMAPA